MQKSSCYFLSRSIIKVNPVFRPSDVLYWLPTARLAEIMAGRVHLQSGGRCVIPHGR